ncbi:MAG TPA: methyltransferase domain-containing protein [Acidimicrobiales bacterium]|nr:methyltransferase domain-containing protein [Acidimicrobiales bacterium]
MPDRYAEGRARMVTAIADRWPLSDRALAAVAAVPREAFVPVFFDAVAPGSSETSEFFAVADAPPEVVDRIYDADRALGLARRDGRTTSTVSAPGLLTSMLDLLRLEPGMRVLEVGTGSGYTAALLAEMVGDAALVTSIDIDTQLIDTARVVLAHAGYEGIEVVSGDGARGVAARAPFDRVVATVGCTDLAPAWFDQLAPGGSMVIPLQHGGVHPLFEATTADGVRRARIVGRSGFVYIQGHQAGGRSPWPFTRCDGEGPFTRVELPNGLGEPFAASAGRRRLGSIALWEFSFFLSLVDHRTSRLGALADATGSLAMLHESGVLHRGEHGVDLADALVTHLRDWVGRGRPGAIRYRNTFVPGPAPEPVTGPDSWTIDRVDHHQVVQLDPEA